MLLKKHLAIRYWKVYSSWKSVWLELHQVLDKRIRYSTLEIREPQTEIKYDLGHVHYFHYILLEYDSLSMANQGKEYIKLK